MELEMLRVESANEVSNLVVDIDGVLLTPPVECGLLPGTARARLLQQKTIRSGIVRVDDLPRIRRMYLVNSVRGMHEVSRPGQLTVS